MPSAVIFDLDGTLLDTLKDIADCANAALEAHGLPGHPVERYRTFVGEGMEVLIARIVPPDRQEDLDLRARVLASYREIYGQNWARDTRPYAGVPELLRELTARGVRMAVLSNKPQRFTELCVRHFLAEFSFSPLFGYRVEVPRKPDPAAALEIAEAWNLAPGEILFVGDTMTDMETARAAGMIPVGVTWGFRDIRELQDNGARHVIDHPRELLPLLTPETA